MTKPKVVWLVEDDKNEADEYKHFLEKGDAISVNIVRLRDHPSLEDYRKIATDPNTGAFVIDQRLQLAGVPYTGMDLVRYLRQIKPELKIYILTGYTGDIKDIGEVEDVISKTEMRKSGAAYVRRIVRSIESYERAMTEHQRRLSELIAQKLSKGLSSSEEVELQKLRQEIERPFGFELSDALDKRQSSKEEEDQLLRRVAERLRKMEDDVKRQQTKSKGVQRTAPKTRAKRKSQR